MNEPKTRAELVEQMRVERARWESLLAQVGEQRMEISGAAGDWTLKDVLAHITDYEQWVLIRLHAALKGEQPPPRETEQLDLEGRNRAIYEQNKGRPLGEVLAQSRQVFNELLDVVQAHSDAFLFQPQQFANLAETVVPARYVMSDSYGHYEEHAPSIRIWLDGLNRAQA